ncbi:MAG: hypothetical protein NTV94_06315 [Planctomycetota bacterium]|nr:hypothetical protein [Planctomycetota bacterium]
MWLNGAGLRDLSIGSAVGGQLFEAIGGDGRMTLHNGGGIGSSNSIGLDFVRSIDAAVDFRVTYVASLGYSFTLTTATSTRTLSWGGSTSQSIVGAYPSRVAAIASLAAATDDDPNTASGLPGNGESFSSSALALNGYLASSRSFNAISVEASAGRGQLSFSNLSFTSFGALDVVAGALASDGAVGSGVNTTTGGPTNSVLRQSVVSDVDLSLRNWMLSGTLLLSGGFNDDLSFAVSENNALFVSMVPLPPAAWAGAVVLGGVAASVRRRKLA